VTRGSYVERSQVLEELAALDPSALTWRRFAALLIIANVGFERIVGARRGPRLGMLS
jgi:hypothetical protein